MRSRKCWDTHMPERQHLTLDGVTARQWLGMRPVQNDSYIHSGPNAETAFAFVADGVGSSSRGAADAAVSHYASLASSSVVTNFPRALLTGADGLASQLADTGLWGASTLAGVVLAGDLLWTVNHGDSTIVILRGQRLLHVSRPHNAAEDDRILGRPIGPHNDRVLTAALSHQPTGATEVGVISPQVGDLVVLMTDGMADLIPLEKITQLSGEPVMELDAIVEQLAEAATAAEDNATALIARIAPRSHT